MGQGGSPAFLVGVVACSCGGATSSAPADASTTTLASDASSDPGADRDASVIADAAAPNGFGGFDAWDTSGFICSGSSDCDATGRGDGREGLQRAMTAGDHETMMFQIIARIATELSTIATTRVAAACRRLVKAVFKGTTS